MMFTEMRAFPPEQASPASLAPHSPSPWPCCPAFCPHASPSSPLQTSLCPGPQEAFVHRRLFKVYHRLVLEMGLLAGHVFYGPFSSEHKKVNSAHTHTRPGL